MQTFLPFADFDMSAIVLDTKRLGNQMRENKQIMTALMLNKGWVNHPATLMWRKYEWALTQYHEACFREWTYGRGFSSHKGTYDDFFDIYERGKTWTEAKVWPYWLGDPTFHDSHKSTLLRKNPEYYSNYFDGYDPSVQIKYPMPEQEYKRLLRVIWTPKGEF